MGSPGRESGTASALARAIDHTLLRPDATAAEIDRLCAEARELGCASVCVNGVHVARCAAALRAGPVRVGTVVGFPLGADEPCVKRLAAERAFADGATELDMVLQLGALRGGDRSLVVRDIVGVVAVAHANGGLVKVILETGLLGAEEIRLACHLAEEAGADYVKTSTGFGPRGASCEDVRHMRECVGSRLGVKAAGGIRTTAFALELLAAGASRIGTSASVAILRGS